MPGKRLEKERQRMTKPISPDEIVEKKTQLIPDYVFEAFNELIAKKWDGHCAAILLSEATMVVLSKAPEGVSRDMIFKEHYLEVEHSYQLAGWKVEFDRPGYNETYDSVYRFYKKKNE
jgi:hypothetical protein